MKCAVHVEADATGFCRNCGKALCGECKREVQGALYCEECLAKSVSQPAVPAGGPSPGLAAFLGFVPGLGAIYNNQYVKAGIHFGIFACLVAILESGAGGLEPLFGMSMAALFVYMPIDAYKTAKARLTGQSYEGPFERLGTNPTYGAYVLIGLGILFLLHTLEVVRIGRILGRGWPVILIILGVLMLRNRMQRAPEETKPDGQ
jgi:hypothetical protein